MGDVFKTMPELLESKGVEENGASKFYQSLASILPHLTLDNFKDTRVVVKHDEVVTMDEFGDIPVEMIEVCEPGAFGHQTITSPEIIALFNQDTGSSVEQLDSYLFTWLSNNRSGVGLAGINSGFVFANGITYCFMPQQVGSIGIQFIDSSTQNSFVGIADGNNLVGDTGTRPAIKSLEFQVCGELAQLTPVEVSVNVIEDGGGATS